MPRFFTDQVTEDCAIISGEDAKHLTKVLRIKQGEEITVCDLKGVDYRCVIEVLSAEQVVARILSSAPSQSEADISVTLYMALPKADKFEWIVQKCVELGVTSIVPVLTHRCVSRPDPKSMEKKLERYRRISLEAAKQSGRGIIPEVCALLDFKAAIGQMQGDDCAILFYENSQSAFHEALARDFRSISIMVGAEGGFEEDEVAYACERNVVCCSLGNRILRCETAPIAALSAIMYHTGNLT